MSAADAVAERRRGVFLDRDGVLIRALPRNGRPYSARNLDDVELLPLVPESCATLREAGAVLIVVTNQPDLTRGGLSAEALDETHAWLRRQVGIDDIRVCPHDDADECDCRKPRPGMLEAAAHDWRLDLGTSVMVGDRWRDVEAGRRAGCKTVFVDRGYDEEQPRDPDLVVDELSEAVPWILSFWNTEEDDHGT